MNRRNFLKYLGLGAIVSFFGKFSKAGEFATKYTHETYSLGPLAWTEEALIDELPKDAESARHFITGDRKEHFSNSKYEKEFGVKGFYGSKPVIYNQDLGFGLAETKVEYTQTNKGNTKKYTQYFISSEQIRDYKTTKTCYTEEEAWGSFWQDYLSYGQKGGTDIYWRLLPVMRKYNDFGHERMLYSVIARFHLNA